MAVSQTTEKAEAIEAAREMEDDPGEITHESSKMGRHSFKYDGVVHALHLPDGWRVVGFGSGWFAIRRER